ncbi:unnamed protein product [Cuscuta campestris]|uniref:Uncharacterized protein n=1 Tax=Cuscuta campestris TaxID=132261 RepID=A0A484KSK7_9ASTE|nr:unnamed protein product [Cuscuta campestris]
MMRAATFSRNTFKISPTKHTGRASLLRELLLRLPRSSFAATPTSPSSIECIGGRFNLAKSASFVFFDFLLPSGHGKITN